MKYFTFHMLVTCLLLIPYPGAAQSVDSAGVEKKKPVITIVNFTGGYSQQLKTTPLPIGELTNGGVQGLIRIVFTRSRLIATGFETGYLRISSMRLRGIVKREIEATLEGIPLFFILGAQYSGVDVHVGLGTVDIISTSTVNGITVKSNSWEMGLSTALGYTTEINHHVSLGGEVRWMGLFDLEKSFLSFGFRVQVLAFEW
jgi:hypothetical protein